LRVCLTADPDNFPACVDDADAVTRSVPAATPALRFDGLPLGTYAIAVIHDENNNSRLDTLAGIPREGFGFSRNPPIRFGAPRFAAVRDAFAANFTDAPEGLNEQAARFSVLIEGDPVIDLWAGHADTAPVSTAGDTVTLDVAFPRTRMVAAEVRLWPITPRPLQAAPAAPKSSVRYGVRLAPERHFRFG